MSKKEPSSKKLSKKKARQMIYIKVAAALAEFKDSSKNKKFENNLRKTSKLFADDVVKAEGKTKDKSKKEPKKKAAFRPENEFLDEED